MNYKIALCVFYFLMNPIHAITPRASLTFGTLSSKSLSKEAVCSQLTPQLIKELAQKGVNSDPNVKQFMSRFFPDITANIDGSFNPNFIRSACTAPTPAPRTPRPTPAPTPVPAPRTPKPTVDESLIELAEKQLPGLLRKNPSLTLNELITALTANPATVNLSTQMVLELKLKAARKTTPTPAPTPAPRPTPRTPKVKPPVKPKPTFTPVSDLPAPIDEPTFDNPDDLPMPLEDEPEAGPAPITPLPERDFEEIKTIISRELEESAEQPRNALSLNEILEKLGNPLVSEEQYAELLAHYNTIKRNLTNSAESVRPVAGGATRPGLPFNPGDLNDGRGGLKPTPQATRTFEPLNPQQLQYIKAEMERIYDDNREISFERCANLALKDWNSKATLNNIGLDNVKKLENAWDSLIDDDDVTSEPDWGSDDEDYTRYTKLDTKKNKKSRHTTQLAKAPKHKGSARRMNLAQRSFKNKQKNVRA